MCDGARVVTPNSGMTRPCPLCRPESYPRPPVDVRRCVAASMVRDIDAEGIAPGSLMALCREGFAGVPGYILTCPGCGQQSGLYLHPPDPGTPRWTVTAGDPARTEGLTLSPSIHHTTAQGGCGWHGYLRDGVFTPC